MIAKKNAFKTGAKWNMQQIMKNAVEGFVTTVSTSGNFKRVVMVYIYRTLWLVFYIPILIIGFLMFVLGIPLFVIGCVIWFIKTGDVEDAPDELIPFKLTVMLFNWYNELLEKIEDNYARKP